MGCRNKQAKNITHPKRSQKTEAGENFFHPIISQEERYNGRKMHIQVFAN